MQQVLTQKLVWSSERGLNRCMAFPTAFFVAVTVPPSLFLSPFSTRIQVSGLLPRSYCWKVEFSIARRLLGKTGVEEHH